MGYFYYLETVGTILMVVVLAMTSLYTEIWQGMLTQCVCVGFGSSCVFILSVNVSAAYFSKKATTGVPRPLVAA